MNYTQQAPVKCKVRGYAPTEDLVCANKLSDRAYRTPRRRHEWNECQGKPKTQRETTYHNANLPITKPTWIVLGWNLRLRGEKLESNCVTYGTTTMNCYDKRPEDTKKAMLVCYTSSITQFKPRNSTVFESQS